MKKSLAVAACAIVIGTFAAQAAQQRGQRGQRGGGEQPPAAPAGQPPAPAAAPAKPLVPVAASTLARASRDVLRRTRDDDRDRRTGARTLVFSVDQDKTKTLDQQILVLAPTNERAGRRRTRTSR